jgi:hypothetical protein
MRINQRHLARMVSAIPPGIERKEAPSLELQIKLIRDEIVAAVGEDKDKIIAMQKQLDALDVRLAEKHSGAYAGQTLEKFLKEGEYSDSVARLLRDKKGNCVLNIPNVLLQRKTQLLESG